MDEALTVGPADLGGVQPVHLRIISEDSTDIQLLGMLRRVREAVPQGLIYHARSAPAWHVATRWDAFNLAAAISADSAEASRIGGEAAEAASLPRAAAQNTETSGPRSNLLKVP